MKSLSSSTAFFFNPLCTYHAQASQGCEQERMDYTLNNKRRVMRLVMQWAAVHGDHLLEEEDAVAFLQVSSDNTAQSSKDTSTESIFRLCLMSLYQNVTGP